MTAKGRGEAERLFREALQLAPSERAAFVANIGNILVLLLGLNACLAGEIARSDAALVLDGKLDDAFWQVVSAQKLQPGESGVPAELGGETRVGLRGAHLCFAAQLPEPDGRVLARSIGRNPVWEKDALESPEVEDLVRFLLRYKSLGGVERDFTIAVNPWGAYRIEDANVDLLRATEVTLKGWTVEAAVPLSLLNLDWSSPEIRFRAERFRSRRPLAPEFRWQASDTLRLPSRTSVAWDLKPPEVKPPALGNTDPPLEVGRAPRLPPVIAEWDAPWWQGIPAFELARNEPYPRAPRYPTRVKWVHDGRSLALLFQMEEPEPVVARAGGRDSAVTSDDHVAVYLATSGSAFLEIAVNTVGAIRDSLGIGPHVMRPQTSWNADIQVQTSIRHQNWIARINIPLDQCAAALGETGVPHRWRIVLARYRAARPGEAAEVSTVPDLGGASTFYGPARYQALVLRDGDPTQVKLLPVGYQQVPREGLAGELATLDSRVWTPLFRRSNSVRTMVQDYLRKRVQQAVLAERKAWEKVNTREGWESFRDSRIRALRESTGSFPPERPALQARVTAWHEGDGYRLENVVFQSRPDYWMTANLYLPTKAFPPMPAMIFVHSQHYPKTQGELHDMGELWARTGSAVLVIERPGYGERVETTPWYRQAYASRFTFTKQLFLVGESYSGWAAWDVIRSVDFLYERPDIDRNRIIVLGAVAGGAEPSAVAAALDPRITAIVPFNYDQGHVRVHGDSPGQIVHQFSPWLVAASVAPRKFVRAFEFGWEGAEEPDYPSLWVDGMLRSEKVWGFYNARENLASSQAYGLIRLSMERVSHCFSIGPQQREGLYPILKRWFNIPLPSQKDLSILPDSELTVNPYREEARRQEAQRRRPHADLLSMPPAVSTDLSRKQMHQIAFETGKRQLEAARARRQALSPKQKVAQLREDLRPILGEIDPAPSPKAESVWKRSLSGGEVEAVSVTVEDGIRVPLLLIRPKEVRTAPVVVALAQGGKERFLANRASELAELLAKGIGVCLPDVRAVGETAPTPDRGDGGAYHFLAQTEFDLGRSLLGSRLKDLRTVLAYLKGRPDIDKQRIALWGDSFSPSNPSHLFLDELEYESGPQIQYRAEPLGAHLALLAALYEDGVRAVAARGGLAGYLSVLENAFTYVPIEDIVLGILKAGDIGDIAAALAPRPVTLEGQVNGRNIRLNESDSKPQSMSAWLVAHLK